MATAVKVESSLSSSRKKIKSVREILKAKTDTEAVNKAMDIVIANTRIKETLMSIKGKGSIRTSMAGLLVKVVIDTSVYIPFINKRDFPSIRAWTRGSRFSI